MMLPALPLLHAAQGASDAVPAFGAAAVAFALALAFGALSGIVTRGRPLPYLRRRVRRRLILAAAWSLALIALLPSIVAVDHLMPASAHQAEHGTVHAAHCHETPASCADAPVTAGPGQMIDAAPLVAAPAMLAILLAAAVPVLIGITRRPNLRPPLIPVAAAI